MDFFSCFQTTTQPQTVTVTVTGSQANSGNPGTKIIQTLNSAQQNSSSNQSQPTIIQPSQGQQFIVTSELHKINFFSVMRIQFVLFDL